MKIVLPEHVQYIIGQLYEAGFEAFAVGGCVRDSILGRAPQDWDITTSAKPEEVNDESIALLAREISKKFEEHKRGTLMEVAAWYREHEPKGEIVIIVAGAPEKKKEKKSYKEE